MSKIKIRLIPALFIKNGLIVRSEGFSYHQLIGNVINEAKRYNDWQADELVYIDISRSGEYDLGRDDHKIQAYHNIEEIIELTSKVCFMPLTFGGGIRSLADIDLRIRKGADKITLNTGAIQQPGLIRQAAEKYGSQAVVISVDYRIVDGSPVVFSEFGQKDTGMSVLDWISECEKLGAGEIFVNSIERDGKANGFDLETIGKVCASTKLPVVACGGCGDTYDFLDVAKVPGISGIAAGNWFHFTENSYPRAKQFLKKNGINIR